MKKKESKLTKSCQNGTNRRTFLKAGLKAGTAAAGAALMGAAIKMPSAHAEDKSQEDVQYLFVQTAKGAVLKKGRLTLNDVAPTMIFFSDRPKRIAGHMTVADFVDIWNEDKGKNSFQADPPNATVSVFAEDHIVDAVFELKNPRLKGNNIEYDIAVLEKEEPLPSGPVSLFIDPVGMPASPTSVAGVHRRHKRRRRHAVLH